MTVQELMAELSRHPRHAEVLFANRDCELGTELHAVRSLTDHPRAYLLYDSWFVGEPHPGDRPTRNEIPVVVINEE